MNIIPNIDNKIKVRKYEDLIQEMIVIHVNDFNETSAKEFRINVDKAHRINQIIIPVIIDSYGGQVHSLLSMISTIENSQIPVMTIVEGKAMSCGAILSAFGSNGYRIIDKNACYMLHDISNFEQGKLHEIVSHTNETIRLNELIYSKLSIKCGQTNDYFKNIINGKADLFLTPDQVLNHKLADKIGNPKIYIDIKVETKITT